MNYAFKMMAVVLALGVLTKVDFAIANNEKQTVKSNLPSCPKSPPFINCYGFYKWSSGAEYVGEWKNAKRHGYGTYIWANGDKYVGEWQNGKTNGQGTKTWKKYGDKYVGELKDDLEHGHGILIYANGTKYEGKWKKGKPNGEGVVTYGKMSNTPGDRYEGQIKEGKMHGEGIFYFANGQIIEGIFKNDKFVNAKNIKKENKKYSKTSNPKSKISSAALDEANKKASKLERKLAALESKQKQEQQQSQPKIVVATKSKSEFPNKSINVNFKSIRKKRDDIAVIIGNANYKKQGKDIPNVNPAYADAEGIKQYFMKAKGIKEGNIIYLKDATNAQLLSVFGNEKSHKGKLFNYIKPKKSNVYIYYAGHGAPGEEGDAYLVPTDTDSQTIQFTGYQLSTLYSNLGKLPAKSVTIILEACFSGGSQSGSLISKASPINITPKKTMIPANVKVIAAGSERQMASWEQDSLHSLFTKYFLRAMSGEGDVNKDGKVSDAELKEYLSDTMTYYARRYYGRDQKVQIHNGG